MRTPDFTAKLSIGKKSNILQIILILSNQSLVQSKFPLNNRIKPKLAALKIETAITQPAMTMLPSLTLLLRGSVACVTQSVF